MSELAEMHITDPAHGGKVICYKCNGFIMQKDHLGFWDHQHRDEFPKIHFHKECYDPDVDYFAFIMD